MGLSCSLKTEAIRTRWKAAALRQLRSQQKLQTSFLVLDREELFKERDLHGPGAEVISGSSSPSDLWPKWIERATLVGDQLMPSSLALLTPSERGVNGPLKVGAGREEKEGFFSTT